VKRTRILTSVMTTVSIGLIIIFLSTTALAATTVRPISDFTGNNDNIAAWLDPESDLTIYPHGWYIYTLLYGLPQPESIDDCDPSGSVQVKELKDGNIMYTVNMHVKGAIMAISNSTHLLLEGEMDYNFQAVVIVFDGDVNAPCPNLLFIWFPEFFLPGLPPIGEGTFSHLTAKGTGTFVNADAALYYGFDPDDQVKVKMNMVGILDKDFEAGHPNYYTDDGSFWPVEIVFFH
jgi:hypothetical protein